MEDEIGRVVGDIIAGFSVDERQRFRKELENCLYDREWCRVHGINHSDPDVGLAKAELYNELYVSRSRGLP